jgi:hypothetical protein
LSFFHSSFDIWFFGIEFCCFSMYGTSGLITRVTSLKSLYRSMSIFLGLLLFFQCHHSTLVFFFSKKLALRFILCYLNLITFGLITQVMSLKSLYRSMSIFLGLLLFFRCYHSTLVFFFFKKIGF